MAAQLDPRSIGSVVQPNPIALDPATSQTQQHFNFRHEALKSSKKKPIALGSTIKHDSMLLGLVVQLDPTLLFN